MVDRPIVEAVSRMLFAREDMNVYAVLDGASVPGLPQRLYDDQPDHYCLYRGDLEPDMREVAPYVVRLSPEGGFTDWIVSEGWGRHWGVFAAAGVDLREMRRHFRTFLMVSGPDRKPMYFRYYDPRVLQAYLPTCTADEAEIFFGPVHRYFAEGRAGEALLRFSRDGDPIRAEKIALGGAA